MSPASLYRWVAAVLLPVDGCETQEAGLAAADSFLVTEGRAVRPSAHRERFRDAAHAALPAASPAHDELDAFWDAAMALIPGVGAWFPRLELRLIAGAPEYRFRLRPAPALRTGITLSTHRGPDPRSHPGIKGPDLGRMIALRTLARQHGADEAVILDGDGRIADGTTTSIVWWDRDRLCTVPAEVPRIRSVTEGVLRELAVGQGVTVIPRSAAPETLSGCEVWALNALHGIRLVTAWADGPVLTAAPTRLHLWRDLYEGCREPMIGPTA